MKVDTRYNIKFINTINHFFNLLKFFSNNIIQKYLSKYIIYIYTLDKYILNN